MRLRAFVAVALLPLAACAGEDGTIDLSPASGKADGLEICRDVQLASGEALELNVRASSFRAELRQEGITEARLFSRGNGAEMETAPSIRPSIEMRGLDEQQFTLRLQSLGYADAPALTGELCVAEAPPLPEPGELPRFDVRFTLPDCAAVPEHGVPAGMHCLATEEEKQRSRAEAGILDKLVTWIAETRIYKEQHPDADVSITMAYLTWNDGRVYDSICRATAAGVRFEGFFDRQSGGRQPPRLAADPACKPENITIHQLGGVTTYPDWRLMHIKMVLLDTGEPTERIVFSSANMSSYATSIHFENWVFSEVERESHFAASHRCAVTALKAAEAVEYPGDAAAFRESLDRCLGELTVEPDPGLRVFFSPDPDSAAVHALMDAMSGAERSVDMIIQHFSYWPLANRLAEAGGTEGVQARLVLDDDTFYDEGESGGSDFALYDGVLRESETDIRFVASNGHLEYGKQYQHNKYVLIDGERVFCGAGNFTSVAFSDNYENFYLIDSSALANAYGAHFDRVFGMALPAADLPESPDY